MIGLAPNLFYNSPMEACIIICKSNKTEEYKNRIVFINAVNEVVRKNAESYLTDEHISKISNAYFGHQDIEDFCKVVAKNDVLGKDGDLNISLYVAPKSFASSDSLTIDDAIEKWNDAARSVHECYTSLLELING